MTLELHQSCCFLAVWPWASYLTPLMLPLMVRDPIIEAILEGHKEGRYILTCHERSTQHSIL